MAKVRDRPFWLYFVWGPHLTVLSIYSSFHAQGWGGSYMVLGIKSVQLYTKQDPYLLNYLTGPEMGPMWADKRGIAAKKMTESC